MLPEATGAFRLTLPPHWRPLGQRANILLQQRRQRLLGRTGHQCYFVPRALAHILVLQAYSLKSVKHIPTFIYPSKYTKTLNFENGGLENGGLEHALEMLFDKQK